MDPASVFFAARSVAWTLLLCGLAVIVLLRLLLPPDRRDRLRLPYAMLGMALILDLARLLPGAGGIARTLGLLSSFALALAFIRLLFAFAFDALAVTRDRVPKIVQDVLLGVTYFVALMGLFSASGVELSSILTTSALVTAVVGFALQDTLGNVIAGLAIQVQRPFKVGDWVSLDGQPQNYGVVVEINWRVTKIVTNEQLEILVPNALIAKTAVTNFSQPSQVVRRGLHVSVAYDVPPSRAVEIAMGAMRATPGVRSTPPPECVLESFGDSGISYWCRFFIDDFRRRDFIVSDVGERIYYEFLRNGITIPYPIRTLHLFQHGAEQDRLDREQRVARLADRFQSVDFLAPLGPDVLAELARRVRSMAFGRGETIVREGDAGTDFYLIERGEVSVSIGSAEARHELARLKPGDFFGEMSLMTGETRRATVVALGDVQAVRVDQESFRDVLSHDPRVLEQVSRVLAERQTALEAEAAQTPSDAAKAVESRSQVLLKRIRGFFRL